MKLFTGCVAAAALILAVSAAEAQVLANGWPRGPNTAVSDFDGPYGPPEAQSPRPYGYGYERGPAPALLPAEEVYAVLRENGFSPLGIPRLRGNVYTIAVIDRRGDDGRLVTTPATGGSCASSRPSALVLGWGRPMTKVLCYHTGRTARCRRRP